MIRRHRLKANPRPEKAPFVWGAGLGELPRVLLCWILVFEGEGQARMSWLSSVLEQGQTVCNREGEAGLPEKMKRELFCIKPQ